VVLKIANDVLTTIKEMAKIINRNGKNDQSLLSNLNIYTSKLNTRKLKAR
jgi:hypothetical protein